MLREAQSIWQISVLTDGAPSVQQSISFILIPSNVYSRTWTHLSQGSGGYYTVSLPSYYTSSPPSSVFSLPQGMTFWPPAQKATLSPHSESAMGYAPPPQVGQPNRAIRQDIHHYPVGWSKWPWCSLHTQFQIPLGSIMGRFKQGERGRPSHLIPTILDGISVWCGAGRRE